MSNLKLDFDYEWGNKSPTVDSALFKGIIDRSTVGPQKTKLETFQSEIRARCTNGKVVILDLSVFEFWDTEGIALIIGETLTPLVRKGAKIGLTGGKTVADSSGERTQLFRDADTKHGAILDTPLLPWGDTYDETYKRLTS